jgi:hypothetical protein
MAAVYENGFHQSRAGVARLSRQDGKFPVLARMCRSVKVTVEGNHTCLEDLNISLGSPSGRWSITLQVR